MNRFRNLPIKRKMLLTNLIISGAVVIAATAALFVFQILNFRTNFQRDTATLAAVIANNSTAALAFNDAKGAAEVVNSLTANPAVVAASLVRPDGSVLASLGDTNSASVLSRFPPAGEARFAGWHLFHTESVKLDQEKVGTLFLLANYRHTFMELVNFYGRVIGGVMLCSFALAMFLSGKLGRILTHPLLQLAETARVVGEKQDYSVRAVASSQGDELGLLTEAFNHMLGRIQNQDAALSLSQQKMKALIHSIDGVVWEWDPRQRAFTFISPQSERLLGYPPERWIGDPNFWNRIVHPEDLERATKAAAEAAQRRQSYSYEYRMLAADHRVVWIRESGVIQVEQDQAVAFRGIFIDVTEQKRAALELAQLNDQIAQTQRQAGMAEVATGVLHNVGNVLNSVNVSASLLRDSVHKSQIHTLLKATSLLRDHLGDTAAFLTQDPKGLKLPGFFIKLGDHLAAEQQVWQKELDGLGKNIEHIKEIVAMQQNYARLSGINEALEAKELVEDAVRINESAFSRHGVTLVREYQDVPRVGVDKHKVLQILINLLRNAKYAMDDSGKSEKILTVAVRAAERRVRIEVRDNGIGIAPDNLARIFQHGFTTKKDGHGFGLHSGANAAREMGGRLFAHSDGPGQGAVFTLELPVAGTDTARSKKSDPAAVGNCHHEI